MSRLAALAPGAAVLALGALLLWYAASDMLPLLVNPRYTIPVVVTGIGFAAIGLLSMAGRWRESRPAATAAAADEHGHGHAQDHHHDHAEDHSGHRHRGRLAHATAVAVLVAPAVIGVIAEPRALGADSATQRGLDLTAAPTLDSGSRAADTAEWDLADWLSATYEAGEPRTFVGKPVRLEGLVAKAGDGGYGLVRFQMTHCTIDAKPVGLPLNFDATRFEGIKKGTWVRVDGVMAEKTINGQRTVVIEPTTVEKIDTPSDPYLY